MVDEPFQNDLQRKSQSAFLDKRHDCKQQGHGQQCEYDMCH